jgi:DNA invertase Pin-like site-specific DNA recombinase
VRTVIVEDASRFARELVTQELGIIALIKRGVRVLTASGDDLTDSSDPSRKMMRQIAGSFAEYEKARLVAKLKAARERKRAASPSRKCEGRKRRNSDNAIEHGAPNQHLDGIDVEKVTTTIETAAASSVSEAAKVSRAMQNAVYEEIDAALDGIQKLATAKSFGEIIHLQSDYLHNRVDVTVARAGAIGGYLSELVHEAANFARTSSKGARLDAQAI